MHRRFNLFSDVFSRTIFIRFFMYGEMDTTVSDFSFKSLSNIAFFSWK